MEDRPGREVDNGPIPKASSARHSLQNCMCEGFVGCCQGVLGKFTLGSTQTESRGAVSPSSQVLRASGVAARTRLHLSGTTLPLLNGQTTCPGRQEGSGCGTLPSPALPNPQLQGPSFLHWFSCLPVISAGLYASKKAFPWLSRMLSVACLSPTQSGAPMGLHRWAAVCLLRAAPGSQAGSQRLQLEASSLPGSWVTRPT